MNNTGYGRGAHINFHFQVIITLICFGFAWNIKDMRFLHSSVPLYPTSYAGLAWLSDQTCVCPKLKFCFLMCRHFCVSEFNAHSPIVKHAKNQQSCAWHRGQHPKECLLTEGCAFITFLFTCKWLEDIYKAFYYKRERSRTRASHSLTQETWIIKGKWKLNIV